jgi:5'-3' exonuclease
VLYIDGPSPEEKRETRQRREEKRIVALQKAHIWLSDMETRVGARRRVRKRDFTKLNKLIRAAFYWTQDARASLAIYLREQGWTVVECPSEADTAIAIDSRPQDIVVSGDSDMLIYATVHTIWRPISRGKYLVYHLPKVLSYLGVSRLALTVLGIVCKNDYTSNLARMGLSTNIKILKSLEERKGKSLIALYVFFGRYTLMGFSDSIACLTSVPC